jgi:hypothetical protein
MGGSIVKKLPPELRINKDKLQIKKKLKWRTLGFIDDKNKKTIVFRGVCELCKSLIPVSKIANHHHLSYEKDITVLLCYTCHNFIHWRLYFHNRFEKMYGKDYGAYFAAKEILKLYEIYPGLIPEIEKRRRL